MKKTIRRCLCILTAAAILLGGIQLPVSAAAQTNGVTVSTRAGFMEALSKGQSPITVTTLISIGEDAEASGRMLPVKIPANTVIQGTAEGSISSRAPIQLEGDGICFQDIELTFNSSDALGSVPHREIFLAGHSLTLDNVKTYLKGSAGGFGGSTEEELLPTVYAGGYPNTAVGSNASLTVRNSNSQTMIQGIYMGHDAGNDSKVPYTGKAAVNLDAKAIVRDAVDTSRNSQADINITGTENQNAKAKTFNGNENTTLTISGASVGEARLAETRAAVTNIGNIVLKEKACLAPETDQFRNIELKSGACLDLNGIKTAEVTGNFAGEIDSTAKQGILVLNQAGKLTIGGTITGKTQFQTGARLFPGAILSDQVYISANPNKAQETNFVLAQKSTEAGYELHYSNGIWTGYGATSDYRGIGSINISSSPSYVNLKNIAAKADESIPDETACFEVKWYDINGQEFSDSEVLDDMNSFYVTGYIICIQTDYWESESEEILNKSDWGQPIRLIASEEHPGNYYIVADGEVKQGTYTFLFCSDYIDADLNTVADVKAFKDIVLAEAPVTFYDPAHTHAYQETITKKPTCTSDGSKAKTCSLCGNTETAEPIPALGHEEVIDPAVEPTETTEGKTEGSHCSRCGEVLKAQETIPATGKPEEHEHEYQSVVTKEATCTEKGIQTKTCSCGDEYTEEIPALGHEEVIDPAVEPTETTEGKTEGSHCSRCGEVLKAQETIPATGKPEEHEHEYQSVVSKEATCTEKGIQTKTCSCGDEYTEEIPALGHEEVIDPAVEPTETTEGKTEGSHCNRCGEVLKAQETIPATGKPVTPPTEKPETPPVTEPENPPTEKPEAHKHTYQADVTKEATCTEVGITIYTCSCGDTYTEATAPLGHQYKEERIPATAEKDGKVQQICSICADIKSVEIIKRPGKITWNKKDLAYDGTSKLPSGTLKDSTGKPLKEGVDYRIKYPKGMKKPGIYHVTIQFCGNYSGTMKATFTIRPKTTGLKKLAPRSKGMRVTWKKQTKQMDGYQIQYSANKNFKGKTTKTITARKTAAAKTISKLKGNAKYYVRVRTYKTVKVNGANKKLYSTWSDKKVVRTKK